MDNEVAVAEEFWLALARNDREGAQEVIRRLEIPPVVTPTFSFELVEGEDEARRPLELQDRKEPGTLSPMAISPDTPASIVDAWNVDARVALVLVSTNEICWARVTDGEVNFLACAGALDRVGGTSCGWATHEAGGKDAKGRHVLKMDLPPDGSKAYVIPVKASGSAVKRPKVFSLPLLPQDKLPFGVLPEGWEEALATLKLCAREWKFFFEVYRGAEWLVALWRGGIEEGGQGGAPPVPLVIPSCLEYLIKPNAQPWLRTRLWRGQRRRGLIRNTPSLWALAETKFRSSRQGGTELHPRDRRRLNRSPALPAASRRTLPGGLAGQRSRLQGLPLIPHGTNESPWWPDGLQASKGGEQHNRLGLRFCFKAYAPS